MKNKKYKIVPAFIDRFSPNSKKMSMREYKNTIIRDIYYLLSSSSHLRLEDIEEEYYERVRSSVLVYGIHSYVGRQYGTFREYIVEEVKNALIKFAPRLRPETLVIDECSVEGVVFKLLIKGEFMVLTSVEKLTLTLNIDIETGHTSVDKK
jgi:predicted component of type VI protein secretion system